MKIGLKERIESGSRNQESYGLKEGDRNTRFFHLSTLVRRRRNRINEIKLEDGSWINTREEIQNYFNGNFKSLYQYECQDVLEDLENLIEPCVLEEENEELCRVSSREEIREVVFEMKSLKTPGPDGFPALFYKHYWETVGD